MDIVVFGAGQVGKDMMPVLEKEYHICYYVDNNKQKWGTNVGNYNIKSPHVLMNYEGSIVIASTKYIMEIIEQLSEMNINAERIYFCNRFMADNLEFKVYPLLAEKIQSNDVPLNHYDLLCGDGEDKTCKRILIACLFYSVYTKQLIENFSKRYKDVEFSLLTQAVEYKDKIVSEQLKHIYYFQSLEELRTIVEKLPIYDAMQFLWIEFEWSYFHGLFREKTKKLNMNVGGSDFYRAPKSGRDFKRKFIACADKVTAETRETAAAFEAYYRKDLMRSVGLLPFGIEVLEYIDKCKNSSKEELKKKFHLPPDKVIVTCGHNALEAHQHMKIIEALAWLSEDVKQMAFFVFPMTYPKRTDRYIDDVKNKLELTGISHMILTDFMDFQHMAEYALISDIMIHVQITDQLSSTMLEELYAKSIVIAGSWLPYGSLHEMGIYFLDADDLPEMAKILKDVLLNMKYYKQRCEENPEIIWNHSSWDMLVPKWRELWE